MVDKFSDLVKNFSDKPQLGTKRNGLVKELSDKLNCTKTAIEWHAKSNDVWPKTHKEIAADEAVAKERQEWHEKVYGSVVESSSSLAPGPGIAPPAPAVRDASNQYGVLQPAAELGAGCVNMWGIFIFLFLVMGVLAALTGSLN